jgi:glutaredoxin
LKRPRITLYGSHRCPTCRQARAYLRDRRVAFQDLDVETNARAAKALARLGCRSVPVILVGDERVDGFDRRRLDRLLDPH